MAAIEVPKEQLDRVYEIVEVAKTSGKIKKGTNETTKAIEKGQAKFVAVAQDVQPPEITMHIPLIAEEKGVTCVMVPSKEELGAAAGIDKGAGCVAVTQEGEAKNLLKEFSKLAPAKEAKEEAPKEEAKEEKPAEKKEEKKPAKEEKAEDKKEEKAE